MSPCITPLHLSNCRGTEEDVRQLDEVIRVDPQALHRLQHSLSFEFAMPLMCAAEAGHPTCLKKLIERGADLLATDRERRYAIFYAVRSGSAPCVEILICSGAHVNYLEEDGSPTTRYLEMACQAGHSGVVEVLLRYGALSADPKVLTSSAQPSYQTPVALAATEGHSQCLKWLIVYGALTELSHVPNLRKDIVVRNSLIKIITEPEMGKATLEQRLEMFRILHEFGYDFTSGDNNILQKLQKPMQHAAHRRNLEALAGHVSRLISTPRTLQSSCRVVIWRTLGFTHYASRLCELKVSSYDRRISESRLNSFLHFHDV